jgi:hypothetical protein
MKIRIPGAKAHVPPTAMSLIVLSSLVISGTQSAMADLTLDFDGMYLQERVTRNYVSTDTWDAPSRTGGSYTPSGLLNFNDGSYQTLCIELKRPVSDRPVDYEKKSFSEISADADMRARILSSLFEQYYDKVFITNSRSMASAFAMMTWEIMLEGFSFMGSGVLNEIDITSGAVQFFDVSSEAMSYYSEMASQLYVADSSSNLVALVNDQYQDQVMWVPAPPAFLLLGLAGLGRKGTRRRR